VNPTIEGTFAAPSIVAASAARIASARRVADSARQVQRVRRPTSFHRRGVHEIDL